MKRPKRWTDAEREILRVNAGDTDQQRRDFAHLLPGRTAMAISSKRRKLALKPPRRKSAVIALRMSNGARVALHMIVDQSGQTTNRYILDAIAQRVERELES